jgi:hypothetical protein
LRKASRKAIELLQQKSPAKILQGFEKSIERFIL